MTHQQSKQHDHTARQTRSEPKNRRGFLKTLGGIAGGAALLSAGCDSVDGMDEEEAVVLDFSTDTGVLNYAYALEQLEAAFYATAVENFYGGDDAEQNVFEDLRAHEEIHRKALGALLGNSAIADLSVDFSSVDFDDRNAVLSTAQTFEDLGVAAYNGAAGMLSEEARLVIAGKIVSVEARHASVIRELANPTTPQAFANLESIPGTNPANGFDALLAPGEVLDQVRATGFVTTTLRAEGL